MQLNGATFALWILVSLAITASCTGPDDIIVTQAWVRDVPPGAHMTAGYLSIENKNAVNLVITRVDSKDFEAAEIHVTRITDGMAKMRRIGQLEIPAGKRMLFEPGGPHLMLIKPTREFSPGDMVSITLVFRDGKRLAVDLIVKQDSSE